MLHTYSYKNNYYALLKLDCMNVVLGHSCTYMYCTIACCIYISSKSLPHPDEATVRNFTASLQGDTAVLFQWYADVNLTQDGTAFSYFRLTLLRQGFPEVVNANLSLGDAQCSNSSMTEFCHEWEGFAAGVRYSVWIEMVYSYPATGGRVDLTVTIPSGVYICYVQTVYIYTWDLMQNSLRIVCLKLAACANRYYINLNIFIWT